MYAPSAALVPYYTRRSSNPLLFAISLESLVISCSLLADYHTTHYQRRGALITPHCLPRVSVT